MAKTKFMEYPEAQNYRSGCKVGFYSYADKKDAEKAAKAAKHNAALKEQQGYDFGYRVPGTVSRTGDGLFEVVIP